LGVVLAFPDTLCSTLYQDRVLLDSLPIAFCRSRDPYISYNSKAEVAAVLDSGRKLGLGEQCYEDSDCQAGGDGDVRCWGLDGKGAGSAGNKFCIGDREHCPFPGRNGLNVDDNELGVFGSRKYLCEHEPGAATPYRLTQAP
jgi:hypothetical protein